MPRSGTTYLYHTLPKHPSIFVPYRKETHFFSVNYHKGMDWFNSLYDEMMPDQIGADINPLYFLDPLSLPRIRQFDPNMKAVLGVRDPVSYVGSQYQQFDSQAWKLPRVEELMTGFNWQVTPTTSLTLNFGDHFFSRRIDAIRSFFGPNLLIYDFRLLKNSPLTIVSAIESFLGLPPFFHQDNLDKTPINASGRRNSRLVSYWLRHQQTLDLIYGILPRRTIRWGRQIFDRLGSSKIGRTSPALNQDQLAYLTQYLRPDQQRIDELLRDKPIQLGSGEPFHPDAASQ